MRKNDLLRKNFNKTIYLSPGPSNDIYHTFREPSDILNILILESVHSNILLGPALLALRI